MRKARLPAFLSYDKATLQALLALLFNHEIPGSKGEGGYS
jgi:hypothetical protein